jgi:hypothetical protein
MNLCTTAQRLLPLKDPRPRRELGFRSCARPSSASSDYVFAEPDALEIALLNKDFFRGTGAKDPLYYEHISALPPSAPSRLGFRPSTPTRTSQ